MAATATATKQHVAGEAEARFDYVQQEEAGQVVVGRPIGGEAPVPTPAPTLQGAASGSAGPDPVVIGAPTGRDIMQLAAQVAREEFSLVEMLVMRYRLSVMFLAVVDGSSSFVSSFRDTDFSNTAAVIGLLGLLFLLGPVFGLLGAKGLRRPLAGVYLGFSVAKTGFQIFLLVYTHIVWFVLIALVQVWVTWIVFCFWRGLGRLTPERIQELRKLGLAGYGGYPAGHPMRSWSPMRMEKYGGEPVHV